MKSVFSIFILAIFAYAGYSFKANRASKKSATKITGSELIGGEFNLTSHQGEQVTNLTYNQHYKLVFFGFTNCTTVCPLGLSTLISAFKELTDSQKQKIKMLFITVDPARDNVETMSKYVKGYGHGLIGLTGTAQQIEQVVKNYRAYYSKVDDTLKQKKPEMKMDHSKMGHAQPNYQLDHSDLIYFMSPKGKYITHFSSNNGTEEIIKNINKEIK